MIKSNKKSDYPVVSNDLLPTVCDILGVSPPSDRPIDGASILPFLKGETTSRNTSNMWAYSIKRNFDSSYQAAISDDRYKVYAMYNKGVVQSAELYDLQKDPFETEDISSKYGDRFKAMKIELEEWRQSVIKSATEEVQCL